MFNPLHCHGCLANSNAPDRYRQLIEASDVIAVARIVSTSEQGLKTVESPIVLGTATRFCEILAIDRFLKGPGGGKSYIRVCAVGSPRRNGRAEVGHYGFFFLKAVGEYWEFVDQLIPRYPASLRSNQVVVSTPVDQVTIRWPATGTIPDVVLCTP